LDRIRFSDWRAQPLTPPPSRGAWQRQSPSAHSRWVSYGSCAGGSGGLNSCGRSRPTSGGLPPSKRAAWRWRTWFRASRAARTPRAKGLAHGRAADRGAARAFPCATSETATATAACGVAPESVYVAKTGARARMPTNEVAAFGPPASDCFTWSPTVERCERDGSSAVILPCGAYREAFERSLNEDGRLSSGVRDASGATIRAPRDGTTFRRRQRRHPFGPR
jgi:hypothetical protein